MKKLSEMMQTSKKSCKLADVDSREARGALHYHAKGSLPDVPSIKNRQLCIHGGTNGEECPSPAAFLTRRATRLCAAHSYHRVCLISAIGRGASYSSSSLGRCLAIPDTQGRGAEKPHVFGVLKRAKVAACRDHVKLETDILKLTTENR